MYFRGILVLQLLSYLQDSGQGKTAFAPMQFSKGPPLRAVFDLPKPQALARLWSFQQVFNNFCSK